MRRRRKLARNIWKRSKNENRLTHQTALEWIAGSRHGTDPVRKSRVEDRQAVVVRFHCINEVLFFETDAGLEAPPVVEDVRLEDHGLTPLEAAILPVCGDRVAA